MSCIALATIYMRPSKTKNIDIKHHYFIRDLIKKGAISISFGAPRLTC